MKHAKKWFWRILIAAFVAVVLAVVALLVYTVASRSTTNDYEMRLDIAFNAAKLSGGIYVRAEDGDHAIDADGIRKLDFCLTRGPVLALSGGERDGEEISLLIGEDPLRIVRDGDDRRAVVYFETSGKSFRIGVRNNDLWHMLREITGPSHYIENQPIEAQDSP